MSSGGRGGLWRALEEDTPWYPSSYRREVNEGVLSTWNVGKIYFKDEDEVSKGDTLIFFFCKTGEADPETGGFEPGIYGWGTVINPPEMSNDFITFRVEPPTNLLKDHPLWDKDIERLTNEIRRRQYQGTMWHINSPQLARLSRKISEYVSSLT
jgi:hypothetical protein